MKEIKGKIVKYELVKEDAPTKEEDSQVLITDVKLPVDAPARMKTLKAEGKKWYLTVVSDPETEKPFALFCSTNHAEKGAQTGDAVNLLTTLAADAGILQEHIDTLLEKIKQDNNVAKLTRTISLLLRHRVPITRIVATLDKAENIFVGSFLFQIKKFLSQYIKDGESVEGGKCEDCGSSKLVFSEGCMTCADCGSSKCG